MRGVYLKRKLKHTKKSWSSSYLAMTSQSIMRGNNIVSIIIKTFKCITSNLNHENFYLQKNLLILENLSP